MRLSEIISAIPLHIRSVTGSTDRIISAFQPFDAKAGDTLTFFAFREKVPVSFSGAVFCLPDSMPEPCNVAATYILCDNPRLAMILAMTAAYGETEPPGIHPSAVISNEARLQADVGIGAFCSIGRCEIGRGTRIHSGCHVYDGVRIGKGVAIDAGAVIGAEGFGFERDEHGVLHRFPHIGNVSIGDRVEIGANVTIDRGTMGDTVIHNGVKIDNGAYVAHNVVIECDAMVMANAVICGSVRIGRRCWVAPGAVIRDGISIGDDALIGLGSVVIRDVAPGETVAGNPARTIRR